MQKSISPPSKSILFNKNLHHNDGLLIGHISRRAGVGYKDAEAIARKYADKILESTRSGNKFIIDELGFFYHDKQNNLQFQSELSANFLLESYSLSDVYFREIYHAADLESRPSRYIAADMSGSNRRKRIRQLVYTGVAASLLAAMVLVPIKTGFFDYTELRLFKAKYELRNNIPTEAEEEIQPSIANESSGSRLARIIPAEYHIITGSFKEFGNARELMVKLNDQGFHSRILCGEGEYFRVSAISFTDRLEAIEALAEVKLLPGMSSAWVLKY